MSLPTSRLGYYLILTDADGEPDFDVNGEPQISGSLVELPPGRWSRNINLEYSDILFTTELGRRWVFPQFQRQMYELTFRVLSTDLDIFRTLDAAVEGQRTPFLLVLDTAASPLETVFVRKEASFDESAEQPVTVGGSVVRLVDYTLILSEEPTGLAVTT